LHYMSVIQEWCCQSILLKKKKSTCLLTTSTSSPSSQISMRILSVKIHIHFEQR